MDLLSAIGVYLVCILTGTLIGLFSGLIPGIHTNTVAAVLVVVHGPLSIVISSAAGGISLTEAEMALVCFLVSIAIAHLFSSYIPATFLGAPEEGTALSVLPGHRLLLQGRGMSAVRLSTEGGLLAVMLCLSIIVLLRSLMGSPVELYDRTRPFIPLMLILVVLLMVMSERRGTLRDNRPVSKEPGTCLLVEELRFGGPDLVNSDYPAFEVWALWGLQGRKVTTKGILQVVDGRVYINERQTTELLFKDRALREKIEKLSGRRIIVLGRVCRVSPRNGHARPEAMAWALLLFFISGALGVVLLDSPGLLNLNFIPITTLGLPVWGWTFMPLFTGLFGFPSLLLSLSSNPAIPHQMLDARERIDRKCKARGVMFGSAAGSFVGWFPGITSAEAALLASQAASDTKTGEDEEHGGKATEEFLVTVGAINTANLVSNFVALFVIFKARSGAAKAAQGILGEGLVPWDDIWSVPWQLGLVLVSILISSTIAYFATVRLSKVFARNFHRVPYRKLIAAVAVMLVVLVFLLSGPLGLVITAIATLLGLIPPTVGVKRVHLMGCLIMPLLVSWAADGLGWGALI